MYSGRDGVSGVYPQYVECDIGVGDMMVWKGTMLWITFVGEWRKTSRDERDEVVVERSFIK